VGNIDVNVRVYKLPNMLSNATNLVVDYFMDIRLDWFILDKMKTGLDYIGGVGDDIDAVCDFDWANLNA
jgi:hypothetical protein